MTLILDSGPLVALGDRRDPRQEQVDRTLREDPGPLIVPEPVATEVEYILRRRGGHRASHAFLEDITARRFLVECLTQDEYQLVVDLDTRYSDLGPGLADLSVVVLAARFRTNLIMTFDERDFRVLQPLRGDPFQLVPAWAP